MRWAHPQTMYLDPRTVTAIHAPIKEWFESIDYPFGSGSFVFASISWFRADDSLRRADSQGEDPSKWLQTSLKTPCWQNIIYRSPVSSSLSLTFLQMTNTRLLQTDGFPDRLGHQCLQERYPNRIILWQWWLPRSKTWYRRSVPQYRCPDSSWLLHWRYSYYSGASESDNWSRTPLTFALLQNTTFGGIQGFTRKPSTAWTDDTGSFAGIVHQEREWTFVLFDGAGHLVPHYKPAAVRFHWDLYGEIIIYWHIGIYVPTWICTRHQPNWFGQERKWDSIGCRRRKPHPCCRCLTREQWDLLWVWHNRVHVYSSNSHYCSLE